jgi:hypothetical protein
MMRGRVPPKETVVEEGSKECTIHGTIRVGSNVCTAHNMALSCAVCAELFPY